MAAPVQRDEELELQIDSLAFGGNGVARLDGFVVFVRAGLPGDTVRARVTKVQRRHAEAITTEVLEAGPQRVEAPCAHYPACGGCRFQDLAYDAQLAAKHAWVEDSLRRIAGIAEPPLEPIVARRGALRLPQQDGVLVRARADDGPELGLHRAGPLGRGARDRALLAHDRPRQPRSGTRSRDWAREERLAAYDQATARGLPPPPDRPRGPQHRPGARPARHARARALRPRAADRGADRVPRGALDPLDGQRHARRGDEPADASSSGATRRSRRSSAACASASARTPSCRRTRAWPSGSTSSRAPRPGSPAARPSTTSTAASARSASRSPRDALTVWGIEISEESVACAIENAELNAIGNAAFFAGNVGQVLRDLRERAGEPGRRRRRPAARRPRRQGAEAARRARRAARRLRLVQPDDARRRHEAARRGVRLPARPDASASTCSRTRRTSSRSRCSSAR